MPPRKKDPRIPEGSKVTRYNLELPQEHVDTIFSLASEENAPLYLGNLPWVTRTGDLVISIVYREAVYILQISEDRGSAEIGGYSGARNLTIGAYASPKQLASLIQRWDRVHKRLMES